MEILNHVLIDTSYYIFYRYYALLSWWKLAKPDIKLDIPYENKEFVEKFIKTFKEKLIEIPKKLKIKNYKIYAALDCPRDKIWRNSLYNKYKENRIYDDKFMGGPFFELGKEILKELNIPILKHPLLEADDCNALFTKYLYEQNNNNKIYIIANDMDYLQLLSNNINIIKLKYNFLKDSKKWSGNAKQDLFCKIIIGDKSDDIPGIFKKCGIKTAIKYYEDEELFNKQLKLENAYNSYMINKKLIDFNEIPEDIATEFLLNYSI